MTIIAQSGARAITLAVVVLSTAVVTRTIGIPGYADWATVLSLVALLGFALDPGITPVVVRRLAQEPGAAPNAASLQRVRVLLGLLALLVIVAMTVALRGTSTVLLAVALGGQVVPRAVVLNAAPWLQVDHRLHRQTVLEAAAAALGLACLVIAADAGAGAAALGIVGFTLPAILLSIAMRRELRITPSSHLASPGPQRPKIESLLREVAPLALALVLVTLYARLFVVFINVAEPDEVVAEYLFAFQFVEQIFVIAGIVAGAVMPVLAIRAQERNLLADGTSHDATVMAAAVGGVIAGALVLLARPLCDVIGGPNLVGASDYLVLLAPMGAIVLPAFILGYVYLALGRGRTYLLFNAVGLAVNLAGNALLTLSYGAAAAARVSWLTELAVVVLAAWPMWRSGADGRSAVARAASVMAGAIAGAELVRAGALPALAGGPAIAMIALLAGGTRLRRFGQAVLRQLPA